MNNFFILFFYFFYNFLIYSQIFLWRTSLKGSKWVISIKYIPCNNPIFYIDIAYFNYLTMKSGIIAGPNWQIINIYNIIIGILFCFNSIWEERKHFWYRKRAFFQLIFKKFPTAPPSSIEEYSIPHPVKPSLERCQRKLYFCLSIIAADAP